MPAASYEVRVVTPERTAFAGNVHSLVAPGIEGYLGVLPHHAPMVVELGPGELALEEENGRRRLFAVSGGYLRVAPGEVSVVAEAAEEADRIDVARAEAARERAQRRLQRRDGEVDVTRAQAALHRALNRLKVAAQARGRR